MDVLNLAISASDLRLDLRRFWADGFLQLLALVLHQLLRISESLDRVDLRLGFLLFGASF